MFWPQASVDSLHCFQCPNKLYTHCIHTLFCNLSFHLWRGIFFQETFSKYALVCTCMCQFTFMSGSCRRLGRYRVKTDICLKAKDFSPLSLDLMLCMFCLLSIPCIFITIKILVIFGLQCSTITNITMRKINQMHDSGECSLDPQSIKANGHFS